MCDHAKSLGWSMHHGLSLPGSACMMVSIGKKQQSSTHSRRGGRTRQQGKPSIHLLWKFDPSVCDGTVLSKKGGPCSDPGMHAVHTKFLIQPEGSWVVVGITQHIVHGQGIRRGACSDQCTLAAGRRCKAG